MKVKYQAKDGKLFDTPEEALKHEAKLTKKTKASVSQYLTTYNGQKLIQQHSLDEEGFWHVFGEDPNCDFGGHHHTPDLGIYEGKLGAILPVAVALSGFWTWGGGGEIRKANITPVRVNEKK